ncbi:hypothetical protein Cantr_02173 [Candida viswanathii]|uniref:Uncharacterized protein n=1 Tax=Candida viswanathii TaxID=5486 RepID=A0A367YN03_9ASCO|nr:hypothetical protein Cantr_02173 [Candida viswanathii]
MPSERPFDRPGLSAPEELSYRQEEEWPRLGAPEELTSPLLMDYHPADVRSSELPHFQVWVTVS